MKDCTSMKENFVPRFPTPPLESENKPSEPKPSGSTSFLIENLVAKKVSVMEQELRKPAKRKSEFLEEKDDKENSKELRSSLKDVRENPNGE